jgi:hypothetical protein
MKHGFDPQIPQILADGWTGVEREGTDTGTDTFRRELAG